MADASTPFLIQSLDHPQPDDLSSEQIRNILQPSENKMLGELNFHSKPRWSDWMGSVVILGTILSATMLVMAV
jgi:hypothetical protein